LNLLSQLDCGILEFLGQIARGQQRQMLAVLLQRRENLLPCCDGLGSRTTKKLASLNVGREAA